MFNKTKFEKEKVGKWFRCGSSTLKCALFLLNAGYRNVVTIASEVLVAILYTVLFVYLCSRRLLVAVSAWIKNPRLQVDRYSLFAIHCL